MTVSLEQFGATGEDATADGAAFLSAVAACNAAGGGTIKGKADRTYHFSTLQATIRAPLVIDLNGATFRRPDGVMAGTNSFCVLLRMRAGSSLEMFGGNIDANYSNNRKPEGTPTYAWQQASTVFVIVEGSSKSVKFHDLVLKDREVFDHLRVLCRSGVTLESLHVANVTSETEHSPPGRADVICSRGIKSVLVEGCNLHALETEFEADEDDWQTEVLVRDCTLARLDLDFGGGTVANKTCRLQRVKTTKMDALEGAYFHAEHCTFGIGSGRGEYVRPPYWEVVDSEILVPATGWSFAAINVSRASTCIFRNSTIRLAKGEPAPATGAMAIRFPQVRSWDTRKHDITFEECVFDLNDFDRIGDPTGRVAFLRNVYRCKGDFAFVLAAGSREQQITVENVAGGFAVDATYSLDLVNWRGMTATDYLAIEGEWTAADKPIRGLPATR